MQVIGVTGTNGKTSITHFLAQCLPQTAVFGTTGVGRLGQLEALQYTTPPAPEVQRLLKACLQAGCQTVAMEVSSHALVQHRVAAVQFDMAVFSNLSRDHLDFHGTMDNYAAAKQRLFAWPSLKTVIINADDPVGEQMRSAAKQARVLTYGFSEAAMVRVVECHLATPGFDLLVESPWGAFACHLPLIGQFNVLNAMAAVAVMGASGMDLHTIKERIEALTAPPGRMTVYTAQDKPTVVVDFAHTPDALEKALQALRLQTAGELWCVFGCGGNRDQGKRAMMGAVADQFSDRVIVTSDNPRHEDPAVIANAVAAGVKSRHCEIKIDRREAIQYTIHQAKAQDVILVAGKGHENYQLIGDDVLPFSDGEVVRETLE